MRGLLVVWKERGMTSHDVVFKLRKLLKMKKIGHTGTLDPDVDGVLLVCLGEATKLVELLMDGKKSYCGQVTLGYSTETEDASGQVVDRLAVNSPLQVEQIDQAMQTFLGQIQQIPPYYSAVKVKGKRLYEYARQGIQVDRPVRQATIFQFERTSEPIYDKVDKTQRWDFRVDCSKGTYVRTLAVDLGQTLGYPAHMSQLTRTATGGFDQAQAYTLKQIEDLVRTGQIHTAIHSIEEALANYPSIELSEDQYEDVKVGKVLAADYFGWPLTDACLLKYHGLAKAIYAPHPSKIGLIKPIRMFVGQETNSKESQ